MVKLKNIIISLIISIGVGQLSAFITRNDAKNFSEQFNQSALTPPDWVFPVVWTILFALMGISSAIVFKSNIDSRGYALTVYGVQLIFNFFWSILFFKGNIFQASFVWLAILILMVFAMILLFYRSSHLAAYLQIPYLVWLIFAIYLNYAVCVLN
ncbi:MAG: tryptophan-rich sensory protein [Ruminococcus sp.]|nr:tryptophan-rich sensory protein [Ruminococcus sp.]